MIEAAADAGENTFCIMKFIPNDTAECFHRINLIFFIHFAEFCEKKLNELIIV